MPDTSNTSPKPATSKGKCVFESTFALSIVMALMLGAGSVYLWYEPFVYGSKRILLDHIVVVEQQRDQVLMQRKTMKMEWDAYKAAVMELGYDEEVEELL